MYVLCMCLCLLLIYMCKQLFEGVSIFIGVKLEDLFGFIDVRYQ